jgi:5'-3' exoribonuclease 2
MELMMKSLGEKEEKRLKREVVEMDEKYINVGEEGWEERYYRRMFEKERSEEIKKEISRNYQEMLTWVYKYYSEGCKNWEMKYNYRGVVLLKDIKILKNIKIEEKKESKSEEEQLKYIMPNGKKYKVEWLYKRYDWEYDVVFD